MTERQSGCAFSLRGAILIIALALLTGLPHAAAQPPKLRPPQLGPKRVRPPVQRKPAAAPERDFTMKTLGGRHYWGDVLFFHSWKIQQNTLTGHYRLLDGDDYRHASGSLSKCRVKLYAMQRKLKLPPMTGPAVVLIHGITRSSKVADTMKKRLQKEGYTVFAFGYPSTHIDIPTSAGYLRRAIASLRGIEKIHIVAHSMGGLIVRSYLSGKHDKRIGRMVMVGTPNNGAWMADKLKDNSLFQFFYGPAGQQLVSDKGGFIDRLPTPKFPFAIVAGARGTADGYNEFEPGDDDGIVSVTSARLPGAADFITVKCTHSFLMGHTPTIDAATCFLKTGRLRKKGKARPIPKPEARTSKQVPIPNRRK